MSQETISIPIEFVFELIDHSPAYILVLDPSFKIIAVSSKLVVTLLEECEDNKNKNSIVGKNWIDYVTDEDKELVNRTLQSIKQQYQVNNSFSYNFKSLSNKVYRAQWFNSYINKNHGWIFSIGIPRQVNSSDVREYYMDIVMKDREYIKIAKEVALKYSGLILPQRSY